MDYNIENYWDKVAENIKQRDVSSLLAGDDEPYYTYKRNLFLKLLDSISFENKKILEIGSGPGGNLNYLSNRKCKEIAGVDVSPKMIELSKKNLNNNSIRIVKIDGVSLPFENNYFDLVFTSTVLQHNVDEITLRQLISSICRTSNSDVVIFERIEKKIKGNESNLGRPVQYYSDLFKENGFILISTRFLPIQASYYICGIIRKLFNRKSRNEGEPISKFSRILELIFLPVTKIIDKIIPSNRDLGMLYFKRNIVNSKI
jgi:ubiquinone/menaquinone biosynthesis C-methylase UbiE